MRAGSSSRTSGENGIERAKRGHGVEDLAPHCAGASVRSDSFAHSTGSCAPAPAAAPSGARGERPRDTFRCPTGSRDPAPTATPPDAHPQRRLTRPSIPRTVVLPRPPQHIQVPVPRGGGDTSTHPTGSPAAAPTSAPPSIRAQRLATRIRVPRAPVIPCPSQPRD